jgi:hypothetical protein
MLAGLNQVGHDCFFEQDHHRSRGLEISRPNYLAVAIESNGHFAEPLRAVHARVCER